MSSATSEQKQCRFCKHWQMHSGMCLRLTDGGMAWSQSKDARYQPIYTNMSFGCTLFEARELKLGIQLSKEEWDEAEGNSKAAYAVRQDVRRYELAKAAMKSLLAGSYVQEDGRPAAVLAVAVADAVLAELAKEKFGRVE